MFKLFSKKKSKKMYEVQALKISNGMVEWIITDQEGLDALVKAGYSIIELDEL